MEVYLITIKGDGGKSKTVICGTDIELLNNIKNATESGFGYTVYKATEVMSVTPAEKK